MRHRIELGHRETDIDVVLPNGQLIQLQYRLMSPSIDICLPKECRVTCWQGDDMEPAKPSGRGGHEYHIRDTKQLVIDLNPDWVD